MFVTCPKCPGFRERICMQNLTTRLLHGDRRALARLITLIENEEALAYRCLSELYPHTGQAHIIGITGSPGAGKSSLVTCLVRALREQNKKVGVIAIDPTSPFTGGALLGDRIRMMEFVSDPQVFIRSMSSRGNLGGLAASTRDVIRAFDAAGYDPILIETVGTGQAEVDIMRIAQTVLVVTAPGMGDDIQAIKAGILEIADLFVVSKADKPGADQTVAELAMLLSLDPNRRTKSTMQTWHTPVLKTSAINNEGISKLVEAIQQHVRYLQESGAGEIRAQRQIRHELERLVQQAALKSLQTLVTEAEWQGLIASIADQTNDPYQVADILLKRLGLRSH